MNTSIVGTKVVAPNTEIVDDTPNAILSRAVARIIAKGCQVQGVYTDGWTRPMRADYSRVRTFEIDVTAATDDSETADVIGQVIINEFDVKVINKVRGIAAANCAMGTVTKTSIGFTTNEVRLALGWRE